MKIDVNPVWILGVPVACVTPEAAVEHVTRLHDAPAPEMVAYANAHTLNLAYTDEGFRRVLAGAGIVLNDGIGVAIAARLARRRFPANLNGSDFNPRILEIAAARGWTVYFLGARPGVAAEAARRLSGRIAGLEIAGTRDGYFPPGDAGRVAEDIARSSASVVMVAMGNPVQEMWLARNLPATGARLGVGVGAFFDFAAGAVPRAPVWMNRLGIEWMWRLAREPRRMWRRYLLGNPLFLARVAKERLSGMRSSGDA